VVRQSDHSVVSGGVGSCMDLQFAGERATRTDLLGSSRRLGLETGWSLAPVTGV